MLQRLQAARKNQKGFTLIELLIVIVILGILAGVVVLAVSGINSRGEEAACDADKRTVMTAVEAYYAEFADWPDEAAEPSGGTEDQRRMQTLVEEGYLKEIPSGDTGYTITLDANGNVDSAGDFC